MKPTIDTKFLPIQELQNYIDKSKWCCSAIVFSPDTENDHFRGCPPYIAIDSETDFKIETLYFEVPQIIAYYGTVHVG